MRYTPFVISLLLFILLYFPLFPQLITEWTLNEDYSHGFIVPILSLYFLWNKKDVLKGIAIRPSNLGLLFVAAGLILYIVTTLSNQLFFQCFSMLIVLTGLVYLHAGKEMVKETLFSIFYLVFMIPLPGLIIASATFQLKLLSTQFVFVVAKLLGISVIKEGTVLILPTATIIIADPCSGLRSIVIFMAMAAAIGYLFQKSIKKRVILILFSIILAMLMNVLRVGAYVVIITVFKFKRLPLLIHDAAGILAIIIGFAILFILNQLFEKQEK
jgi:exosortase